MRRVTNFGGFDSQRRKEEFSKQIKSIKEQLTDNFSQELAFLLDDTDINMFIGHSGYTDKPINDIVYSFNLVTDKKIIWNQIKDDFIPFLQRANKKFDIKNNSGIRENYEIVIYINDTENYSYNKVAYLSFEEVVNDKNIPDLISRIEFYFKLRFEQ